ncbi:hypothetical protein N8874_00050 [Gammaproteobacteria bacterium]|jgi:hypothetical protein|nr:hypothetical protein [Gammaproteobacteria bacterium]
MMSDKFLNIIEQHISDFFFWCVHVLEVIGEVTGMGYALANIVIFVILEPALIILFFYLWIREKKKNEKNHKSFNKNV